MAHSGLFLAFCHLFNIFVCFVVNILCNDILCNDLFFFFFKYSLSFVP